MSSKRKKVPRFKTETEEAEFWSTHDSTEYWDDLEKVLEPLELEPSLERSIDRRAKRKKIISIRLEDWQIRLARAIAAKRKVPYHSVIRAWVEHGIRSTRAAS
jgi:hypothetical protein